MPVELGDEIVLHLVLAEPYRTAMLQRSTPDEIAAFQARFPHIVRVGALDDARFAEISSWVTENCQGAVITNYQCIRTLKLWESAFGLALPTDAVAFKLRWSRAFPTSNDMRHWV